MCCKIQCDEKSEKIIFFLKLNKTWISLCTPCFAEHGVELSSFATYPSRGPHHRCGPLPCRRSIIKNCYCGVPLATSYDWPSIFCGPACCVCIAASLSWVAVRAATRYLMSLSIKKRTHHRTRSPITEKCHVCPKKTIIRLINSKVFYKSVRKNN